MTPLSVLDLAPVTEGSTAREALQNTLDLARTTERLGYHRYWLAEHHNMTGIASAATSVVIAAVAAATSTIRVGSGGVMLPNHAPLVIAEQFGTLESLYPGRIDLGLGRAPGTDPLTTYALRRPGNGESFPEDVLELQAYFKNRLPTKAVPGYGLDVPIWLLGSSLFSARLAARLGLPFAFASHFAPTQLMDALSLYRELFEPSEQLRKPYAMLASNVVVADTEQEARRLQTSSMQQFVDLRRGTVGKLKPPLDTMDGYWNPQEKAMVQSALACSQVGTPDQVARGLRDFIARTRADEVIITSHIFDHQARLKSYELLAQAQNLCHIGGPST